MPAHHAPYDLGYTRTTMALNKEKQDREVEQNSETTSQFGLQAATRLHEVGIASNRGSACHGEYVPGYAVPKILDGKLSGKIGQGQHRGIKTEMGLALKVKE